MTDTQTTTDPKATALARPTSAASIGFSGSIQLRSMGEVYDLAELLSRPDAQGMVPKHYGGRPAAIAAVILCGIELGMGAMESLRSIHIIEGKPCMSAELMLARARRFGHKTKWLEMSAERAEIEIDGTRLSFTMAEAKAAGITGKDNWKKYPAAMLRARASSAAVRAICPEVLGSGIYTPEEINPDIPVDEAGDVVVANIPVNARDATPQGARREIVRLSDASTPADVMEWCKANRRKLAEAKNGTREKAIAEIRQHAKRVGCNEERALAAASLDGPAPAAAPQEAPPETHAPGTLRFAMGHHAKGSPISELSDEGLASYRTAIERGMAKPERARWKDDDAAHLAEVDRESARRRGEDEAPPEDDARTSGSADDY